MEKVISGALKSCIAAHGPITDHWIGSAAKRIAGSLLPENQGVYRAEKVTVRRLVGGDRISDAAWAAVVRAVAHATEKLQLEGHLFVSVVGAPVLSSGDGEDESGFAVYHRGMQHIVVAGGEKPEQIPVSEGEWITEVRVSVYHEIAHFMQDIRGRLDGGEANEEEAEQLAYELLTSEEE